MEFGWKRLNRQIDEYQSELVQTHYAEVENMYRQMRGWRHDYRNHIQTMKAYAAKGDLEALRRYLDELDDDLTTLDMVIKTGNPMTDAILNSKISLARSKQVQVVADAHIPVKLRLPELDLCCILGNLFDNAIEASLQLPEPERLIRVYMEMKGEQLYISFTNFTAGKKLKKTAGRFATSKGKGHGLGLMQMDRIIRPGWICGPQFGGWRLYHRDFAAAAAGRQLQFVPKIRQFVPEITRGPFFVLCCRYEEVKDDEKKIKVYHDQKYRMDDWQRLENLQKCADPVRAVCGSGGSGQSDRAVCGAADSVEGGAGSAGC